MDNSEIAGGSGRGHHMTEGVGSIANVASEEIKNLISDVEDLLARITNLNDTDVTKLRTKVSRAMDVAKESLLDSTDKVRLHAVRAATTADDYVHDSPWQAIGIAALVGAVVGILATRRS